jgi:hypothetical protein
MTTVQQRQGKTMLLIIIDTLSENIAVKLFNAVQKVNRVIDKLPF